MPSPARWPTHVIVVAFVLLLAACGAQDPVDGSPGSSAEGSPGGSAPSAEDPVSFVISHATTGINSVPSAAAADALREMGYDVETVVVDASELSVEGVATGRFAFGASGNSTALLGMAAGGDLKFIVDELANEWSLYARQEIEECADLDGQPVGIFSEGGVSTAMVRNYFATSCPDAEPSYLILGDSPTRAAALVAGEIAATPVELSDALNLEATAPDVVHELASFAEALPDLKTTSFYGNSAFMAEHPQATRDFIRALLEQFRRIDGDPEYLREITLEYYPSVSEDTLDAAVEAYVERGLFPVNGGLTEENLEYTIDFFVEAEVVEPGITVDQAADLSYLEAVLDEIGEE